MEESASYFFQFLAAVLGATFFLVLNIKSGNNWLKVLSLAALVGFCVAVIGTFYDLVVYI